MVSGALRPLRERNFRLLAGAQVIDYLGNGMAPIGLAFAVLDLTGSVTDLGIVVGVRSVANVLLLVLGGVLADRFPRAVVLQGSALLAGISQAVVAASVLGRFDSMALLAGLGVINGAASAMSMPASLALIPQTVPATMLRQANVLGRMSQSGAGMIGAALGGAIVGISNPGWALAIDSASFFAVALCFARMRLCFARMRLCFARMRLCFARMPRPVSATTRVRSNMPHELRVGWRAFVSNTWVWVIVVQFLVLNAIFVGGVQVLGPGIADHTIGRTAWGLVRAAQVLGSVLGGLLAAHWQPRRALFFGVSLTSVEILPLLALGRLPTVAVLIPAMFLTGLLIEQFGVAWAVALQQNIPEDRLARVYSYDVLGSFVAIPIGQLAIGPLADVIGDRSTLDIGSAAIVVATLAALAVPSVRRLNARGEGTDSGTEVSARRRRPTGSR